MSRKGFTLVEIAIVLLVIGLILGLAVKGRTLIDSARIRSEIRKLERFQTAFAAYVSRTGSMPISDTITSDLFIDKAELVKHGYLNNSELNTDYKDIYPDIRWNFAGCTSLLITPADPSTGKPAKLKWGNAQNYAPGLSNICVTTVADNFTGTLLPNVHFSKILSCYIENMVDDRSYFGGSGRAFNYGDEPIDGFDNCSELDNSSPYGYKIY
jgi:prepilin-type N-terminal cleavage/methylation domain-containing protein